LSDDVEKVSSTSSRLSEFSGSYVFDEVIDIEDKGEHYAEAARFVKNNYVKTYDDPDVKNYNQAKRKLLCIA
jgi:hypothetical protein